MHSSISRNVANKYAIAPSFETAEQYSQAWNNLAKYFLYRVYRILTISWKSSYLFFHTVANKHEPRK